MLVDEPGQHREAGRVERLVGVEAPVGERRDPARPDADRDRLDAAVGQEHPPAGDREVMLGHRCRLPSCGERLGGVTRLRGAPARKARTFSVISSNWRESASSVCQAMCGVTRTFGAPASRCERSGSGGSCPSTSRNGAAEAPLLEQPAHRLVVDDAPARGVDQDRPRLHEREPVGGEQAARLVGERDVDGDDVGAGSSSSRARCTTPGMSRGCRDQATTSMPNACPSSATRRPIVPRPTTPSVLPASSKPRKLRYSKRPARVESYASKRRRPSASSAPNVNSATDLRRRCGNDSHGHALRRGGLDVDVRVAGRARGDESQLREALEHGGVDLRVGVERDEHVRPRGADDDLVAIRRAEGNARGHFCP